MFTTPAKKRFSWSYSKMKNFEICPRKHEAYDLKKIVVEAQGPDSPLAEGNRIHAVMHKALRDKEMLPIDLLYLQPWIDKVLSKPGELYVEQQYAITDQFTKCAWFAPNAWFRAIGDAIKIYDKAGIIWDWKTGKIVEDSVQLALTAQCLFCHFPQLEVVASKFVWLAHECETTDTFTRGKLAMMWPGLYARLDPMKRSFETGLYTPKPSGMCVRYCGVTTCEFHGKGTRR